MTWIQFEFLNHRAAPVILAIWLKLGVAILPRKRIFRQDGRFEAQRRKTAKGSPKGERSESIKRIHRNSLRVSDVAQNVGSL